MMPTSRVIEILLVEDNPAEVDLARETLELAKIHTNLHVAMDGVDAMRFLRQEGEFADKPRPDLVLLDLNLPRKDGREVLQDIKGDPELRSIPVVVLTSSTAERDVVKTYSLGANCYITKPVDLEQFSAVVKSIEDFWFVVVRLPPHAEH